MKDSKFTITLFSLLSFIIGVIAFYSISGRSNPVELAIIVLIVVLGAVQLFSAYKRKQKLEQGFAVSDELSESIKYKSGYLTFKNSFYVWVLFLYLEIFGIELEVYQIVGGGVMLTAFLFLIIKRIQERRFGEE